MTTYQKHIDYDIDAERAVIGVFLFIPNSFGSVHGMLNEDCFYDVSCQTVYKVMAGMWAKGIPVDAVTVTHELYKKKIVTLCEQNTGYWIGLVMSDVYSDAHLETWCLILRELAARRLMLKITHGGLNSEDVVEAAGQIREQINNALDIRTSDDWERADKVTKRTMDNREAAAANKGVVGISTTFPTLDTINSGFRKAQLIILAARPSVGKSALAGQIATKAAEQGYKVGFITLEMENHDLVGRMISQISGIPHNVIDRELIEEEAQRNLMYNTAAKLAGLPIYFSEKTNVNIHDIRAKAEKLKVKHGCDLLIIDYLQLIEETKGKQSREQAVSEISRGLKMLAKNMQIPVIALSQLNRNSEGRSNKKPSMSDLRESGSLEQDADIVMLLHSDFKSGVLVDANGHSTEGKAVLIVPKWRNETTTEFDLRFEGDKMRFCEWEDSFRPGNQFTPVTFEKPNTKGMNEAFKRATQKVNEEEAPF